MRPALLVVLSLCACRRETKICADPAASASPAVVVQAPPQHLIDVPFPKAADVSGPVTVLAIDIAASGAAFVSGRAVADDDAIDREAKAAYAKTPDLRVVIRADRSVPYGRVIALLDRLKRSGVSRIAFAVDGPAPLPAK